MALHHLQGQNLLFTPMEYHILKVLVKNPENILARQERKKRRVMSMTTMEVLTLLPVIFAALSCINKKHNKL